MRAIILAGGYGKRMWPVTRNLPKPLLPIGGRPAIDYIIDKLLEIDVTRIVISTNMKFKEQFQAWLAEKAFDRIEIVAERSTSENEKLGATRALSELAHQFPADDYIIVAGDNLFRDSLKPMVTFYNRVGQPVVAIFEAEDYEQARRGSIVTIDQDMRIVNFEEKPTHPTGRMVGACIYILPHRSLLRTGEYLSQGGRSDEPGNFIAWLCRKENVYGFRLERGVWDIGSIEEYERTQREFPKRQPG